MLSDDQNITSEEKAGGRGGAIASAVGGAIAGAAIGGAGAALLSNPHARKTAANKVKEVKENIEEMIAPTKEKVQKTLNQKVNQAEKKLATKRK